MLCESRRGIIKLVSAGIIIDIIASNTRLHTPKKESGLNRIPVRL